MLFFISLSFQLINSYEWEKIMVSIQSALVAWGTGLVWSGRPATTPRGLNHSASATSTTSPLPLSSMFQTSTRGSPFWIGWVVSSSCCSHLVRCICFERINIYKLLCPSVRIPRFYNEHFALKYRVDVTKCIPRRNASTTGFHFISYPIGLLEYVGKDYRAPCF